LTLAPLLDASPIIRLHAAFAFAAIGLGAVQLLAPKGTLPHRTIGWAWALLMILVAGSSFFIHTIRTWGTLDTQNRQNEKTAIESFPKDFLGLSRWRGSGFEAVLPNPLPIVLPQRRTLPLAGVDLP
jgi:hypothetical protein